MTVDVYDLSFVQADRIAKNSTCQRRQVGAVLRSTTGSIVAMGWNHEPQGRSCAEHCPRGQLSTDELPSGAPFAGRGACIATHAEMQALGQAMTQGMAVKGFKMYVNCQPCETCARVLRQAKVKVYWT